MNEMPIEMHEKNLATPPFYEHIEIKSLIESEFDKRFYCDAYPDIAEAVRDDPSFDLVEHYIQSGWRDGRDPNVWFSTADYLSSNADVAAGGMNPFFHYLRFGRSEKRLVNVDPEIKALIRQKLDVEFYNQQMRERTSSPLPDDVDPVEHYLEQGWRRGLDPNEIFATSEYLEAYPDVKASGMNPFAHYLGFGKAEGRRARRARFRNDPEAFFLPLDQAAEARMQRVVIRTDHALQIRPINDLTPELSLRRATKLLNRAFAFSDGSPPNWWIGVGTALGMVREGDFILNDTDIDIRIGLKYRGNRSSRAAAAEIVEAFKKENFSLVRECYFDGIIMQTAFCDDTNHGVIVDIYYFYEGISEQCYLNVNEHTMRKKPRHLVDNKKAVAWPTAEDISVFLPYPPEEYLSWRFGPEWNIRKAKDELTDIDNKCLLPVPRSTVLTYGTFDVFHQGHLHLLERARELGDHLVVGVVSDALCEQKGKTIWQSEQMRRNAVANLSFVDEVFIQREPDQKEWDIDRFGASFLVVGDDWKGHPRFEQVRGYHGVEIIYLRRTPDVSSSLIKAAVAQALAPRP